MTAPIDTAYVDIEPSFDRFMPGVEKGINAPLESIEAVATAVTTSIEESFAELTAALQTEFDTLFDELRGGFEGLDATAVSTAGEISLAMEESAAKVAASFDVALDDVKGKLATTGAEVAATGDSIIGKFGGIAASAATLGGGAAVAGLGALTLFGLKSAASLEQTQVAFDALTGSVTAGQAQFTSLQKFAAATPFTFNDLTTSAEKFDAFAGSIGQTQQQLIPFLTTIGNLVSETGGGAQALDSISLALGQTAGQGKLTLGNLEQINNAIPGFNAVAAIAAVRGESTAQTMQEISAGSIDAKTGINQLLEGMNKFPGAAGAMDKQSQTLLGVFSTFQDTVSQTLSNAFAPAIPAIKSTLGQITPIIGTALQTLAPALGTVVTGLLTLLGPLINGLSAILTPLVAGLGSAFADLAPAMAPLGAALGAIASALAPILPLAGSLIAALVQGLAPVIASLAPLIAGLVNVVSAVITPLLPVIVTLGQSLGSILLPVFTALGGALTDLAPQLAGIFMQFAQQWVPIIKLLAPDILKLLMALEPLIPTILQLLPVILNLDVAFLPLILAVAQLVDLLTPLAAFLIEAVAAALQFLTVKALIPVLETVVGVVGLLGATIEAVFGWLDGANWGHVGHDIAEAFKIAGEAIVIFGELFWAGIKFIGQEVWDFIKFIGSEIGDFFAWVGSSIAGLASSMWSNFTTALDQLNTYIEVKFDAFVTAVENLKDQFIAAIMNLWNTAEANFIAGIDAIVAYVEGLPDRAMHGLLELKNRIDTWAAGALTWLYDAGKNILQGLVNGVEGGIDGAVNDVKGAVGKIITGAENVLDIHSPSKVFHEMGTQTVMGYRGGVNDNAHLATSAVTSMLSATTRSSTMNTTTSTQGPMFAAGAIIVQFNGVVPSQQDAYNTGAAVGAGIADTLGNASGRNAVRTM